MVINTHTEIRLFLICGKPAEIRRAASVSEHLREICDHLRPEPTGELANTAADSTMERKSRIHPAAEREEHPH